MPFPGEAAAFLIADFELRVSAVSEGGEKYFGAEEGLIGTRLLDLLTSPLGDDQLCLPTPASRPSSPATRS